MRKITRLSYSAMGLWESRPDEFFMTRMSETRPEREPQGKPAAVGSAFDARVKSALYFELFGKADPKYAPDALFEAQVEPQNRDWALAEGEYVFECYQQSGFYASMLADLKKSSKPPRFEFEVNAVIEGVPMLCKPDGFWTTPADAEVVLDWKVNGYCSKSAVSPHKSYMLCRDGWVGKQSRSHDTCHKEFLGKPYKDIEINTSYLEASNPAWADQLTLYAWAMDSTDPVLSIHQIVGKAMPVGRPQLRVAQYRAKVSKIHQDRLRLRLVACWEAISSGHIFGGLSRAESDERCELLENAAKYMKSDGTPEGDFNASLGRQAYRGF